MQPAESTTLYFQSGSSDKVYQIDLQPAGDGFAVNFAFGRRGTTLKPGTKTQSPVPYTEAKRIFETLVKEKTAKGYSPGTAGTPYVQTENEGRASGILPQLLNPIEEADLKRLLDDPAFCFQEKHDGKRLLLRRNHEGTLDGINRKGLVVGIPEVFVQSLAGITEPFILDGEAVGEKFHVFDILRLADQDIAGWKYGDRLALLDKLAERFRGTALEVVGTAIGPIPKCLLLDWLRVNGSEGVVAKRLDAASTPGRPNSGGPALKFKFTATASAIVTGVNAKRSVSLGLLDEGGTVVEAGNVTIPANQPVPNVEALVEVQYLYAMPQSGKLYQPVYKGVRDDLDREECTTRQLKYKAG